MKRERGEREPAWGTMLALREALAVSCQACLEAPRERPEVRGGGRGRPAPRPLARPKDRAAPMKGRQKT
jgi:hypothetical protein